MRTTGGMRALGLVGALALVCAAGADAATLTADDAVRIALKNNSQVVVAEAGILDAKGGLYGAYGSLLPSLSGGYSYSPSYAKNSLVGKSLGGEDVVSDVRGHSTSPAVTTTWGILDLSSWSGLSAARQGLRASRLRRDAARNDVALSTRRQFYAVVQAIKLAQVSDGALQLARDDERRVKAMFEVGSVSKSDLLKAQVRTAQSEFDQLSASHQITVQRVALASEMGVRESDLGDVDTLLAVTPQTYDEAALIVEAAKSRPDLIAADAELQSARASHSAARMARLPYISMTGSAAFKPRSKFNYLDVGIVSRSESDLSLNARVSVNWDLFDLARVDAGIATARARLDRARDASAALHRNLASEVHEQLLAYNEAVEQNQVAERGQESAIENLKLTQEKYNVGSATILELIDAQVQLQTAQSNLVKALAAIRVAEAQINRVRGHNE